MRRIAPALVVAFAVLVLAPPAHATLNACSAAKKKCVAKKAAALLKCHSKNEKPPTGLTPAAFATCIQKAHDKFDGGANPSKGCFAKAEAKYGAGGCLTVNDTSNLETTVDDFVNDVVCQLDPGSGTCPTPTPSPTPPQEPTPTPGCSVNGQACASNAECCSLTCQASHCVPAGPSCTNGMQDGNETGVDCGGGTCPACPLGGGCAANTDCQATTICSGGTCVCGAGLADCNGSPGDGCEASLTSDPNNCGGCGNVCSLPNANSTCVSSQCFIQSCNAPYADCNGTNADGCEANTQADNSNCGMCGHVCGFPQTCQFPGNCM